MPELDPEVPELDPEVPELDPAPELDPEVPELDPEVPELDPEPEPDLDPELEPEPPVDVDPELLDDAGLPPPSGPLPGESAGDEQALAPAMETSAPKVSHDRGRCIAVLWTTADWATDAAGDARRPP